MGGFLGPRDFQKPTRPEITVAPARQLGQFWNPFFGDQNCFIFNQISSHFLDNLEMKTIVKDCFEKWKEEQELFGIDTTKYWVV